jgi:hypothetical protein
VGRHAVGAIALVVRVRRWSGATRPLVEHCVDLLGGLAVM